MTNPMEICLADEVRKALRAECCGAALVLALTISDAYGKIAFPEEKVGKRYKEWYRRYCGYDGVLKRAVSDEFKTPSDDFVKQPQTPRRS